jgi:LysR family transcriptional regulator, hca operon transcriptional activator
MELRHLRYFVAVAEAGGLTGAAQRKLHTSQPSLSRQIHDLEEEVGAQLLTRRARGIELTPAGRTFLDHARLVLCSWPGYRPSSRPQRQSIAPSCCVINGGSDGTRTRELLRDGQPF